jgi:hypothetical protein
MALNLTGIFADVGNLATGISMQDIVQQVAVGALGTVVLSGAQTSGGQDALDPLHIFHHAPSNTTGVVQGNVIKMSAYQALTPDQQKMFAALNYTVIPG